MKTLKINDLDFNVHTGPIGISMSGGADSAIMLYILMMHAVGPIHVYTCANKLKNRTNPVVALNILGYLIDLTKKTDIYHHTFFVDTQTFDSLFEPMKQVVNTGFVDIMYTAGTALPPDQDLWDKTKFSSDCGLYHKRNKNVLRPVYNGKFYSPWWNQDKKFVFQVYQQFNLLDTLFPLTRSCESLTQFQGHCGQCWWCQERFWGFGRL